MHARRRGRAPSDFGSRGAEGATAPETLRQKDCGRQGALESGGRTQSRPPTEGVSREPVASHKGPAGRGESLRVQDRGGISRTRLRPLTEVRPCPLTGCPPNRRRCGAPRFTICIARAAPAWSPFAGYEMPVQYPAGIIAEHLHTRAKAGLFDVSHMGQIALRGDGAAQALETLVPGDLQGLAPGRMRYTLLLNESGGILDDLMATRRRRTG